MATGSDARWNSVAFWSDPAERAFARALLKGRWEMFGDRRRGLVSAPRPFRDVIDGRRLIPEGAEEVTSVPLDSIIGSVGGRGYFFTRSFYPKTDIILPRWKRAYAAARGLRGYEPIESYETGGVHFVVDGHFRVSVAGALRFETIQAVVRRWG